MRANNNSYLTVIASIVGVGVAIFGIFGTNLSSCRKEKLESTELENKLKNAYPRISVCYADVAVDLNNLKSLKGKKDKDVIDLSQIPKADNGLLSCTEGCLNDSGKKKQVKHFVYLLLENKGGEAAIGIKLQFLRSNLSHSLAIRDTLAGNLDYQSIILAAADNIADYTQNVSIELPAGKRLLIPLLIAEFSPDNKYLSKQWNIVSKVVYLPKFLMYQSAVTKQEYKDTVRVMEAPVKISDLLEIRG